METRELAIITLKKDAAKAYANQIRDFLGNNIKINLYSYEEGNITYFKEKLIVLSVKLKYDEISSICAKDSQIIIPRLTFEKSSFKKLSNIDKNEKTFVYNLTKAMALETITIIRRLGFNKQNLIPSYPGSDNILPDSVILTPGEEILIESYNCEIIDLGYRTIDLGCISDIAIKLNLEHLIKEDLLQKFTDKIVPTSYIARKLLVSQSKLESIFELLLSSIDEGLVCVSEDGIVQFYTHSAREILSINDDEMIGKYIGDYIKSFDFSQLKNKENSILQKLVKVNNIDINFEIKYTDTNSFSGFIIKLVKFYEAEKKQAKLRAELMKSGNVSKYNLDDIIGCSEKILNTKKIAYKMAQSNSSILIMGESGTGKELFAQSIHSASSRERGPFVAVNCSTFQEGLLQSELFGYEEGAFTGAKKGGKKGIFELANQGTIFLDEIGEMDLNSQASLLRVIQEREVRRVGSDKVIDLDIRIIAATNRDLKQLVKEKKFRQDLFYRLNVLPLNISPLRDRIEDLFLIFESFKKNLDANFTLSNEVIEVFENYSWEGNIRELRNIAEYFSYIDKDVIKIEDLPEYILEPIEAQNGTYKNLKNIEYEDINVEEVGYVNAGETLKERSVKEKRKYQKYIDIRETLREQEYKRCNEEKKEIERNIYRLDFKRDLEDYIFVLEKMIEAFDLKQRIGRRRLHEYALKEELFLGEQQIRSILLELQEKDFVKVLSGRGGSIVTEKGRLFLKEYKKISNINFRK